MKNLAIFGAMCIALLLGLSRHADAVEPLDVSLVQLIATPSKYHGKTVRVIAYFSFNFESQVLYLHREDFDHLIFKNGVWIAVPETTKAAAAKMNGNYVLAVGKFDMKFKGHKGLYSGAVQSVERFELWISPPLH